MPEIPVDDFDVDTAAKAHHSRLRGHDLSIEERRDRARRLGSTAPQEAPVADQPRLSVNINEECADVLRRVKADQKITVTEAIRRAIGLLAFAEETRRAGSTIRVVPPADESRFWTLQPDPAVPEHPLNLGEGWVGVVDEEQGGVVAWVHEDNVPAVIAGLGGRA